MRVTRSRHYVWRSQEIKLKAEEIRIKYEVISLFNSSKQTYGTRRILEGLKQKGYQVGRFRVRMLMKEHGLKARYPKKYRITTNSNHTLMVAPNILNREFNPVEPNKV